MKNINISGKFEGIFDLRSKDNNAKVRITMTSWTKLKKVWFLSKSNRYCSIFVLSLSL